MSRPPGWQRPINDAAADSTASRKSKAARLTYDAAGTSWIKYTADFPENPQWAIGWTIANVRPYYFHMLLRVHGTVLDWGTLKWCPLNSNNGCYDPELIVLHEFGHVQGLGHNDAAIGQDWLESIMQAAPHSKDKTGWNMHAFGPCDVARLQMTYEALTPSTLYSTCLSLDTTMWLSAPQGPHQPGTNVLFTATFKIANTEAANLAGDELDARLVTLQRRLSGGSWTNYTSMSSVGGGSGQYRVTLSVYGTYEYRARYVAGSGEGLNGSSSSAVEVVVDPCQLGPLVPCP